MKTPKSTSLQSDIATWADSTFGRSNISAIYWRSSVEFSELGLAIIDGKPKTKIAEEVADVIIVFYRLAEYLGIDLDAEIKKKMAINRKRKWIRDGNGNGRHA